VLVDGHHAQLAPDRALTSRSRRGAERGQALAETALILPIIVLLLVAVVDIGRGVYAYTSIANAARQGARVAAVNQLYPAETDTQCSENMPVEDLTDGGTPTWSARACAANAATSLGIRPGSVVVSYAAPAGSTLACPAGPAPAAPSANTPFHVGCVVNVTVSYTWSPITPLIGNLVGAITMSSTSQMLVERVFP
jgi:Flp pilus assembly protein TadG